MVFAYLVLRFAFKKFIYNFIDPINLCVITVAISVANIVYLYLSNDIDVLELCKIVFLVSSFFGIVFLFSLFFRKEVFAKSLNLKQNWDWLKNDKILYYFVILTVFVLQGYFSIQMVFADAAGDFRLVIAKENRFLDVLRNGFVSFMLSMTVTGLISIKERKYFIILILYAIFVFVSGSKSALSGIASVYYFFYGVRTYEGNVKSSKFKTVVVPLFIAVILSLIVILYWSNGNIEEACYLLLFRMVNAGDVYFYSYLYGDYKQLFGKYDFLAYVLHPFLKIMGSKGYDFPLGAELFGLVYDSLEGYGPNPHLPVLALVLSEGNLLYAFFIIVFFATVFGLMSILLQKAIALDNIDKLTRLYCINIYLFALPAMYIDIGIFETNFISITFVVLMIIIVRKMFTGTKYLLKKREG